MRELDAAFDRIEQAVLPTIAAMLDALIDSAAGARPGVDAEAYAGTLRALAAEIAAAESAIAGIAEQDTAPVPRALPRMPSAA